MTRDELKKYNGKNGQKAYVAYKGKVYDVTDSTLWQNGEHEQMHQAGRDLTDAMKAAPHGAGVFKGFKEVGELEESKEQSAQSQSAPATLNALYKRFHPHPMSVHFPIALHLFAAFFNLLFLFDKSQTWEQLVFYSLSISTLMGVFAMITGIMSWKINYAFSASKIFKQKLYLSILTLGLGIVALIIYFADTDAVYEISGWGVVYHAIVFVTALTVIMLGYLGGIIAWGSKSASGGAKGATKRKEQSAQNLTVQNRKRERYTFAPQNTATALQLPSLPLQSMNAPGSRKPFKELNIQIGGPAGAGINTVERLVSEALKAQKLCHFITSEFMSRVRGGSNTTFIRIAEDAVAAPLWQADIFIALDEQAYEHSRSRVKDAVVITDKNNKIAAKNLIKIPVKESVKDLGSLYENSFAFGFLCAYIGIDERNGKHAVKTLFKDKNEQNNLKAFDLGFRAFSEKSDFNLRSFAQNQGEGGYLSGNESIGFGFLSGGVNFISSYPMSPSTGVFTFLAGMGKTFPLVLEQAEDEIAALNMVIGAWYAGGRGLTTTSGGGFSLMSEALSLAGMSETPALVYLAQRPGPATGLATRTEQGDLNLALHAGHGNFPRLILAPGDSEEATLLAHYGADFADYFQIPVIYMADQFFADSIRYAPKLDFDALPEQNFITPSKRNYRRYADTDSGLSPRAIPGYGEGIVRATSGEHSQNGQITEDYEIRNQDNAKRARKLQTLREHALAPQVTEGENSVALVGWGSTKSVIAEVAAKLGLSAVHFYWLYPLNEKHLEPLKAYDKLIVVENNDNGQFQDLLRLHGIRCHAFIGKADGFCFFSDELRDRVNEHLYAKEDSHG